MNPVNSLRTWLRERRRQAGLRTLNGGGGYVPAAPVLSGTYITPETALGLAAVFAAVNVISRDLAGLPRAVGRRIPGGGLEPDESHPLHDMLVCQVNEEIGAFRFFQTEMSHVLTRGNGYCEIVRDRGRPVALHTLHPSKTVPKRTESRGLYYELTDTPLPGGQYPRLAPDDVLHLAGLGFNGLVGYSPVTVARQTIGLGVAVEQYGAAYFGNSAKPHGILKTPQKLSEPAVNNLRRTFNQVHQGSQSAHQLMILEQGMDWVQAQFSPEDGQFLLTRQFQVVEIARLYNVPPHKLGDYSESHLANVEEANLDYVAMTIYGWVCMLEDEMNRKLLTREERRTHRIFLDMEALLRGNTEARMNKYQTLRNVGAISADEIRVREGLKPIGPEKGGDLLIVQGQYLPLDQVGKQPLVKPGKPAPESNGLDFEPRFILNGNGDHP